MAFGVVYWHNGIWGGEPWLFSRDNRAVCWRNQESFWGVGDGRGHEHGFGADGSVARLDVVQRVIFELPAVELGLALES
jgi:hypothetical protein